MHFLSEVGGGGERALNQLLLQDHYDYFIGANYKVTYQPLSGDESAHLHPKQTGPPPHSPTLPLPQKKADLPFTQDTVNKKTRFQNVNPLLIPIFFIRMKSRRPHLAHLLLPGSRGLDSFAGLSPLRVPFILSATSRSLLLSRRSGVVAVGARSQLGVNGVSGIPQQP